MKARSCHFRLALLALFLTACSAGSFFGTSSPAPTPGAGNFASAPTNQPPTATAALPTTTAPPTDTAQPADTALPAVEQSTPTSPAITTMPDPSGYAWQSLADGLVKPVGMANAGDGSGRLFILEQGGRIRIWQSGSLLDDPFLDLTSRVDCCGERGLLGLAFHPDYAHNGYFFVNYTERQGGELYTVIARFQVSSDSLRADPESEARLLHILQPYENHNGGGLAFGPDGYLYIGLGDGGSGGDPLGNAQSRDTLLGKLLRLDVDSFEPYAIPYDNPFAAGGGLPEIWAYGLRNPWRFSFDPLTGDLYIADVGQNAWEEINFLPASSPGGANFGWNYFEGLHAYQGQPPADLALSTPVAEYSHELGASVTGGFVYRGMNLPEWQGVYFYGDYGSGRVWGLLRQPDGEWQNALLFETGHSITAFGVDETGEIYLLDYNGSLLRFDRK